MAAIISQMPRRFWDGFVGIGAPGQSQLFALLTQLCPPDKGMRDFTKRQQNCHGVESQPRQPARMGEGPSFDFSQPKEAARCKTMTTCLLMTATS